MTLQKTALDAQRVYWANTSLGTVVSVLKEGGPLTTVASGLTGPTGVALDDTFVYFTDWLRHTVSRAPKP